MTEPYPNTDHRSLVAPRVVSRVPELFHTGDLGSGIKSATKI